MTRYCDCGCEHCRKQVESHSSCSLECQAETVEQIPRHGREIIVVES